MYSRSDGNIVLRAMNASRSQLEYGALVTVDPTGTGFAFYQSSWHGNSNRVLRASLSQ